MKHSKCAFTIFTLLLLSVSGWAGDRMKANIQIYQTVHIGSTELAPGEYQMTWAWTQSGSDGVVTIWQDRRVITTVPARVTQVRSGYRSPVLRTNTASNTLTEIELPKISFYFGIENATRLSTSN